jgi:predicted glycosyltransferase
MSDKEIKNAEGSRKNSGSRVLIYSHDTMGLGHLRRCRAIAHALVERYNNLSVLILSGSPIIGSFDFRARVDFVRIPGVIKLRNGEYTALNLHIDLEKTLSMRSSIIKHTALIFDPDVFIVDKEPLGLRGEVEETLEMLKERGTHLVLGLRDVMDSPTLLVPEWKRKKVLPALRRLYDSIWIYGLPQICEPMQDIALPKGVQKKVTYTGYLRRHVPKATVATRLPEITQKPYILVTTGGGGDGEDLIEWVLRAYETDPLLPYPALFVLGPFMAPELQADFQRRAAKLKRVQAITFDTNMEVLEQGAAGIVAMGGYNTFCEVLSMDRRAIIVPRTAPRLEQYIRASRAQSLGLVQMLESDGGMDPQVMADALRALPRQKRPSEIIVPGLLEGLENVNRLIQPLIEKPTRAETPVAGEDTFRRQA